ncbi:MAG: hypothetical protein KatS3mg035_1443 [Bacteroidia bacterium]|nr:MAG: hypothetical protein KatS3mg035_1443 [Bacteroidia bacterium]
MHANFNLYSLWLYKQEKLTFKQKTFFPIIKKFLYSDHEIFLRELVSNAVDATQKLIALSSLGEFKGNIDDTTIEISLDKDKKTLTIKDKGYWYDSRRGRKIYQSNCLFGC